MKALALWRKEMDPELKSKVHVCFRKAWRYIKSTQQEDGSWLPLWFGNEDDAKHHNPVYGTSIVLYSLTCIESVCIFGSGEVKIKAVDFLLSTQNQDGGWGGNASLISTIEETSLAIRALSGTDNWQQISMGINWLQKNLPNDLSEIKATPIGLYFASLWYFEDMYPLVFASSALKEIVESSAFQKEMVNTLVEKS
jgi:squalene-hopene/tetraprenyl-beta-curcumene cyclase